MKKTSSLLLTILLLAGIAAHATIYSKKPTVTSADRNPKAAIIPDVNKILYVDKHISGGNGTGNSWVNAVAELSDALVAANTLNTTTAGAVQQIWVAVGTYTPTALPPYSDTSPAGLSITDQDKTFYVPSGVKLYGGFDPAHGITLLAHHRILPGVGGVSEDKGTILSGDIGTPNNAGDNCYHVVLASASGSLVEGVTIDGFTITGGAASENNGIIRINGNWTYRNRGGGIAIYYGLNTLKNNAISGNSGISGGGFRSEYGSYTLTDNVFINNSATNGGGLFMNNGGATELSRNVFSGNSATISGGGINSGTTNSAIVNLFSNNVFTENRAAYGGGIYVSGGAHRLTNNTFSGNSASTAGGAYADALAANSTLARGFYNNVFWNNKKGGSSTAAGADYYRIYNSTVTTFKNNLLQLASSSYTGDNFGLNSSTANLFETDPTFVAIANPTGADGLFGTSDDGLKLQAISPAINAGDLQTNSTGYIVQAGTVDITGAIRIQNNQIDAGAYEVALNALLITAQPTNKTLCSYQPASFSIAAQNAQTYKWQVSPDGVNNWTDITDGAVYSGVTSTTLTVSNPAGLNGNYYRSIAMEPTGPSSVSSDAAMLTVNDPPQTLVLASSGPITCTATSVTLTASSSATSTVNYTFIGSLGTITGSENTVVVTAPGIYTVTATALGNGCAATATTSVTSATATISVSNPTTATATPGMAFSQTFNASGGDIPYSFSIASGSLPDGLTLNNSGVLSGTPTQSGNFSVTVQATDANGCTGTSNAYSLSLINLPPTIEDIIVNPYPVCLGSPINFSATLGNVTGSYAYTLTNGSSTTSGTSSNPDFNQSITATLAGAQTFTLTVSSQGVSTSVPYILTIQDPPTLTLTVSNDGLLTCAQTSLTLTATADGGSDYQFSGPDIQDEGFGWAVVNGAGVYSVTVTNGETGCFSTTTTIVSSATNTPSVSISPSSATLTCASPTVSLSAIGAGSIHWSTGATTSSISVSTAATYSVTLTSGSGCTATTSISVEINQTPVVSITSSATALTNASPTVSLTALGTGTLLWSTGATTAVISVSASGLYSVTLTNPGGCSATATVAVRGADLTINLDLPQANFASSGTATVGNFVVHVFEVTGLPTSSGNVAITVTAPVGYTLAFAPSLTNINVSGGEHNPVAVDNPQWTVTHSLVDRQLTLTMNSGAFISGGSESSLGFSITRTNANSGSVANITVNVADDLTMGYDGNLSNNVYARVITGL